MKWRLVLLLGVQLQFKDYTYSIPPLNYPSCILDRLVSSALLRYRFDLRVVLKLLTLSVGAFQNLGWHEVDGKRMCDNRSS